MKIPTRTVESGISVPGELGRFHLWNGLEGVRLRFLDSPMDGQKKKKEEKKLVIRYKYKLFLSDSAGCATSVTVPLAFLTTCILGHTGIKSVMRIELETQH